MCRVEERKIGPTGLIKLGDYVYSTPNHTIGRWCQVYRGPHQIIIRDKNQAKDIIAIHSREDGNSILLEHILPSLVLKPGAMIRWFHKKVLFPKSTFKRFYERLKNINSETAEREYLKTLNLIQHTTLDEIEAAIELVIDSISGRDLYEEIKGLVIGENRPSNLFFIEEYDQKRFKINLEKYDELIPN